MYNGLLIYFINIQIFHLNSIFCLLYETINTTAKRTSEFECKYSARTEVASRIAEKHAGKQKQKARRNHG